jgi:imidazolonepropionase-like amidohydrolase
MRYSCAVAIALCFILTLSCSTEEPVDYNPETAILLKGANLFDAGSGMMNGPRDLLIDGGLIVADLPADSGKEASRVIDCTDKYIIPGLGDSHIHLAFLTTKDEQEYHGELAKFVKQGVLFVRDVGGPVDVMQEMKRQIRDGELTGPEIFYTGPMLESSPLHWEQFNEELPSFTVPLDSEEDVDELLPVLAEKGATLIKTFNNLKPELYPHIVTIAAENGLKIVHDPGRPLINWVPLATALELGVTSFEHGFAAWAYVLAEEYQEQRAALSTSDADPEQQMEFIAQMGGLGAEAISVERLKELSEMMVAKDAVLCPTLWAFQGEDEDQSDEATEQERHRRKQMMEMLTNISSHIVRELARNGVRVLVGQDNCEAEGTLEEMKLLAEAGVPEVEVLKGATIYAAHWLEVDDRFGSLETGKSANLVVLDADPLADIANVGDIHLVIQNGAVVE